MNMARPIFYNDSVFRGAYQQKGYGLGGVFQKFFRWVMPIVQQHAMPALESGAKTLGQEAISSISNIAKDIVSGKNVSESTQQHLTSAVDNLKEKIEKKLTGKGIKGRKPKKKYIILKRRKIDNDIFSQ